jgi:tRNA(Ile)-lysidine synthase
VPAAAAEPALPLAEAEAAPLFEPHLKDARGIVVAVSGGPDSMTLLALLASWQDHPPLLAATIDHGLRAESASEAAMVARFAASLGLPHRTLLWAGVKPASGLHEAAREVRYTLLEQAAREEGFDYLVTAHHADDQAETILMRLIAGSGIAGLSGMQRVTLRGGMRHVRPFLDIPKARLVATCKALGVPSVSDPSNRDDRFTRARIRGLLPLLASEGLTADRLATLGRRAARAEEALAAMTMDAMSKAEVTRDGRVVSANWQMIDAAPEDNRVRVLAALFGQAGAPPHRPRLEQIEVLARALHDAATKGLCLRRSLGGRLVTLASNGRITLTDAPPRRETPQRLAKAQRI